MQKINALQVSMEESIIQALLKTGELSSMRQINDRASDINDYRVGNISQLHRVVQDQGNITDCHLSQ